MVTRLESSGGWAPMVTATTVSAAVTTIALRAWKGSAAPWGKTGIVCQIVFSAAVGYFYANLFKRSVTPPLSKVEQDLIEFTEKLRTTPPEKLDALLTETPLD